MSKMILEQTRKRHSSRPLLIRQYLALQILMFGLVTMISRRSCHAFLTGHVVFNARQISFLPRMAVLENTFATYEMSEATVPEDKAVDDAELVRPLLKHTQLETRPLQVAYDANRDGWDPMSFHQGVDAKGATVIVAREKDTGRIFGGYNPKGFCSYGGARPSVAAFLFYEKHGIPGKFQKLQKLKDGKLSCARDDADFGISFGTSDLVVGLQLGNERQATSRLGEYFECGPENLASLFGKEIAELEDLKVLVGCYGDDEDIPYSGEVLDSFQFTNNGLEESIFFN